jgi:16S rRNA processing protein RimM
MSKTEPPAAETETWVRLGVVGRPHGVKGALKLHLDNPEGGTVVSGLEVRCRQGNRSRPFVVQRWAGGVLTFEGVADRTVAEGLVNAVLEVRRSDFNDDEDEDAAYLIDLIGRRVVDAAGHALGVIASFTDNGAQVLADVKTSTGSVLVPFLPPIVVAIEDDHIVLAPPAGLFNDAEAIEAGSAQTADQQAAEIESDEAGDEEAV